MKKFLLPILLLHLAVAVNAATYYFSSVSGDDARSSADAQNYSTPWKSIAKLNLIMPTLKPGDQVLFKRNETFDGAIVVTVSGTGSQPITFGAFGSGNNPVINGFSTLSGWVQARANVWEASFSPASGSTNMVTMNDVSKAIGRYPNAGAGNGGYLTINSHSGNTELVSSQLPSSPNWTGADIVVRKNRWVLDRSTVSYHYGTTIGFTAGSSYGINDKFGFFIENHTNTLDQNGEWYYDKTRGKLQMYFDNNNPTAYTIKGSVLGTLVTISFQNYLAFTNLTFSGADVTDFNLTNSSNITMTGCSFMFSGTNAIQGLSSSNIMVRGSAFSNIHNDGLYMYWNCSNITVTGNTFKNIGVFPGMGANSSQTYKGMYILGSNNMVSYNTLDSIGYSGIHVDGDYDTVKNNYVNTFCFVKDDGGGIYTGQGLGDNTVYNYKLITGNIVLNGIGARTGIDDTTSIQVQGIYLDDNSNHVTVTGNTTAYCGQTGIFCHNSTYMTITGNTMFDNGLEQFLGWRSGNPVSNVIVRNNIMFARTATQLAARMDSYYGSDNLGGFGNMDSNYYCRPIDNDYLIYSLYMENGSYRTSYYNLDAWKTKYGFDRSSKGSPVVLPKYTYNAISTTNQYANENYNQNIYYVNYYATNGDIIPAWNANKLDAGTLQVTSRTYSSLNKYMLSLPAGNVTVGKGYLLSFTLQGEANNSPMEVYLRKSTSTNMDLTSRVKIPVTTTRTNQQFAFTANSNNDASIELDIAQPNGAVWIDNMKLQEATITNTNPTDYILFKYNATKKNITATFSGVYYDATGKSYNGKVVLKPYTSVVLVKQASQSSKQTNRNASAQAINVQGKLTEAPASNLTAASSASLNWQITNQSNQAAYYTIERSSDNANFTLLNKTNVKTDTSVSTIGYQYNDATPASGKNYYRITQYDEKGVAGISQIATVNNVSFKINPNPVQSTMHLMFDQTIKADDHLNNYTTIRNTSGVVVKTLQLPSTANFNRADLDVSSLKAGMYIFSIVAEGQTFNKMFLKE